jgi:hypothetical protein
VTRASWRERKQTSGAGFVAKVAVLVRALDHADFEAAEAALDPGAVYEKDGVSITGGPAIVASYHPSRTVRVHFEDHIEVDGRRHCYRCEQEMMVGRSKRVERIVHHELSGEREALEAFLAHP